MGHRVVQIKPNLALRIPCVLKVYKRMKFFYSLSRKISRFSHKNLRLTQIIKFEKQYFLMVHRIL